MLRSTEFELGEPMVIEEYIVDIIGDSIILKKDAEKILRQYGIKYREFADNIAVSKASLLQLPESEIDRVYEVINKKFRNRAYSSSGSSGSFSRNLLKVEGVLGPHATFSRYLFTKEQESRRIAPEFFSRILLKIANEKLDKLKYKKLFKDILYRHDRRTTSFYISRTVLNRLKELLAKISYMYDVSINVSEIVELSLIMWIEVFEELLSELKEKEEYGAQSSNPEKSL